jgi:hypothetical protein
MQSNPYSYDPFVIYESAVMIQPDGSIRSSEYSWVTHTVYSDRLVQWDYDKHGDLCLKHFGNKGQYWDSREPSKIEAFLRDYLDEENLVLIKITQHCNQSNGYPCWQFDYATREDIK